MQVEATTPNASTVGYRRLLLVILSGCLVLLGAGGPLLLRVYFVHGGQRLWLSALLQCFGWPLMLPPMCVSLFRGRRQSGVGVASLLLPPRLVGAAAVLGVLFSVNGYVYALGSQALPLSTSSLLLATQLVFTAVFAFFLVGLRFTPFSANAVVLLTIGPAVLSVGVGSGSGSGKPSKTYWTGFCEAIAASAGVGLLLPLTEVAVERYGRRRSAAWATYSTVIQMQAVMGATGTAACLLGMGIKGDFGALRGEAAAFGLGEAKYWLVLTWDAVSWQLLNLGTIGLITCASSLLAGIMTAVLLSLSEILAVIFLHEKLDGPKGIALVLSLWGFASYLYGEKKLDEARKQAQRHEQELGDEIH
ncbi:unnamed protein product [Alopecurus aequalis]